MTALAMRRQSETFGNDTANSPFDRDLFRPTARPAPQFRAYSPAVVETDARRGEAADRQTEARIAAVLGGVEAIKTRARNVYVSVSAGVVTLYGAVRDSGAAREIEQSVRANTGIDAILNNIHTIGARVTD